VTDERIVPFASVFNFRDLGGYPTDDGRSTRWGRLFRSDALHDMTVDDLELFRQLGVASIIDLRNPDEVARTGRGLLGLETIHFVNPSVLSTSNEERVDASDLGVDYLYERYLHYLDVGREAFVRAIQEMAKRENYPMVFNCFFGKDRTGVLASLLLRCIGVRRQAVIDDYVLTSTRVDLILERLRRDPVNRDAIEQSDPVLFGAEASTMSKFLHELERRHGGAREWFLRSGVSTRELDVLVEVLLE
jgi:protein-tyrosine phosphatase